MCSMFEPAELQSDKRFEHEEAKNKMAQEHHGIQNVRYTLSCMSDGSQICCAGLINSLVAIY